jgi:hypothetical protein
LETVIDMNSAQSKETLTTSEVLDRIFKDPTVKHGLIEFQDLGRPIDKILNI